MKRFLQTGGLGLLLLGLALPASAQRRAAPADADEPGSTRVVQVAPAAKPDAPGHDQDTPGVRTVVPVDPLIQPNVDDTDSASSGVARVATIDPEVVLDNGRDSNAPRASAAQPVFVRDADQPVEFDNGRDAFAVAGSPSATSLVAEDPSLLDDGRNDEPEAVVERELMGADAQTAEAAHAQAELPSSTLQLAANYPNPFSARTSISFVVPTSGTARVTLYDLRGREVAVLFDGAVPGDQPQRVELDASDLAAGVYIYALDHAGQRVSRQLQVVR